MPKTDDALDSFINTAPSITPTKEEIKPIQKVVSQKAKEEVKIKKSLILKKSIDDALRLESATTREKQIDIMEIAITQYLQNKGYKNI